MSALGSQKYKQQLMGVPVFVVIFASPWDVDFSARARWGDRNSAGVSTAPKQPDSSYRDCRARSFKVRPLLQAWSNEVRCLAATLEMYGVQYSGVDQELWL